MRIQYTYMHATFDDDYEGEFDPWGVVTADDHLPYVPVHQFVINFGTYYKRIALNLSSNFAGPGQIRAGQGEIPANELIPQQFDRDISTNYQIAN